jgi:hypothetical protein
MTRLVLCFVFSSCASSSSPGGAVASDPTGPRIWDYCELARQHEGISDCVKRTKDTPQLEPLKLCCTPPDGPCVAVEQLSNCDPDDWVALCEWGQSNTDGTITCYD